MRYLAPTPPDDLVLLLRPIRRLLVATVMLLLLLAVGKEALEVPQSCTRAQSWTDTPEGRGLVRITGRNAFNRE